MRFSSTMRYVTNSKEPVVISRSGEVLIVDSSGGKRNVIKLVWATLSVVDGDKVNAGQPLANWDPLSPVFIC